MRNNNSQQIKDRLEIAIARELMPLLMGPNDSHLRFLEEYFNTTIFVRESSFLIDRKEEVLSKVIEELLELCKSKGYIDQRDINTVLRLQRVQNDEIEIEHSSIIVLENPQIVVKTRTPNQANYIRTLSQNELVFAIGPAGTGKTFLAVAWAVAQLEKGAVNKIVLVKPVVEAGEKLGYLPGDIKEKVDPYFRPLYDALLYMLPAEKVRRYIDQSLIEIAPLAFMRGRTLSYSIAILDEAQNTTAMQMKMFLTRMGPHSQAVVTGDMTQIDLEKPESSGLLQVQKILIEIKGISFVYLDSRDVVRHRLVSDIIRAYDSFKSNGSNNQKEI